MVEDHYTVLVNHCIASFNSIFYFKKLKIFSLRGNKKEKTLKQFPNNKFHLAWTGSFFVVVVVSGQNGYFVVDNWNKNGLLTGDRR